MLRSFIIAAPLFALAACSGMTADNAAADIKAACAVDMVKAKFPHVCADPERYAKDAATAAAIAKALRNGVPF